MATVLLYNLAGEKARRLKLLCLEQKLRVRTVTPQEQGLTLRALLDGAAPEGPTDAPFTGEMLVMADMTRGQMDAFLGAWRGRRIPPVPLKAVTTPVNLAWSSVRLFQELSLEHEAMTRGLSAHGQTDKEEEK